MQFATGMGCLGTCQGIAWVCRLLFAVREQYQAAWCRPEFGITANNNQFIAYFDVHKVQMNSIINNCGESKLLELKIWFETSHQKGVAVAVQVGTRAPLIHNDYEPLAKIYFYDITPKSNLPVLGVSYNSLKIPLDLSSFEESKASKIEDDHIVLHFVYNLLDSTKSLPQKYYVIKQQQDRFARGCGLQNLIRGQSQFLTLFERNGAIEQIRAAEQQQQRLEKDISMEIIKIKRKGTDFKVIFLLFVLLLCLGVILNRIDSTQFVVYEESVRIPRKHEKKRKVKKERVRV